MGRDGELSKGGFGGQIVFVDRKRDVVIVMFASNATLDSPFPDVPLRAIAERYFGASKP